MPKIYLGDVIFLTEVVLVVAVGPKELVSSDCYLAIETFT